MKKIYKILVSLFLLLGIVSYSANLQAQTYYSLNTSSSPSSAGYASPGGGYYPAGQQVTVTAIPVNGYTFAGWTGSVNSNMNPVTITMNSNKTLIANFVSLSFYNLTVNTVPSNGGYFSGAGTGQFPAGQPMTMYAIPFPGYRFVSWTGSVNSTANPLTFTMNSNMTITVNFEAYPIKISAGTENSLIIKSDGTLFACGGNKFGEIGDGTTTMRPFPVQIGNEKVWKDISAGSFFSCFAIKSNGTLWAWGCNRNGALGDGTTIDRYSPVQIGTDANWAKISAGHLHSLALKTDGSLYAWGYNCMGALGDSSENDSYSPIRIGTENNWKYISAGTYHSMAIKTDGTLWAWGANGSGELGIEYVGGWYIEPVQVGTDNDWKQVCISDGHTLAIKNNGTLWSWGLNENGQIGDGTTIERHTPIQIGTDNDWMQVSSNRFSTSMALKTNGTIWGWGNNHYGELGDGTTTERHIPTQALGITNKIMISSGDGFSIAIGNENSLCGSGNSGWGELGDGAVVTYRQTFNCASLPSTLKSSPSEYNIQNSIQLSNSKSTLSQNYPNPTYGSATIDYYLDDDATNAKIVLYNFTGSIVKEYILSGKGKSTLNVDMGNLSAGIYSYALFVNGSKVGVKKLLLTK
jgi:uncharacterized repeat protein (TIGR02543 family)